VPAFASAFGFVCASEEVQKGNYEKVEFWRFDPRVGNQRSYRYWFNSYHDDYYCPGSGHAEHARDENAKVQIDGDPKERAEEEERGSKEATN